MADGKIGSGRRRRKKATSASMGLSGVARIEKAAWRQAKVGSRTGIGKSRAKARLCMELEQRDVTASRSQSIGNPKIALTVMSDPNAKETVTGDPDVSVCGAQ